MHGYAGRPDAIDVSILLRENRADYRPDIHATDMRRACRRLHARKSDSRRHSVADDAHLRLNAANRVYRCGICRRCGRCLVVNFDPYQSQQGTIRALYPCVTSMALLDG